MDYHDINQAFLNADSSFASKDQDKLRGLLSSISVLVENNDYTQANALLSSSTILDNSQKKNLRSIYSINQLYSLELEWTNHGIWRSFRFWSIAEKTAYLQNCLFVLRILSNLTPYVSLGFGSVLGFVRDKDFIPHDDDMDIIIALPEKDKIRYQDVIMKLKELLEQHQLIPYNFNETHMTVLGVDIFIGFYDVMGRVSWFPSRRHAGLNIEDIFPTQAVNIHGVKCEIPRNADRYLELTYGPAWRQADQNFSHPWDFSEYSEFA
jgi:hypothetical protein